MIVKIIANYTLITDWYGFKDSNTQNLLNLYNVFNSGAIDKAVPFPSRQESRQWLGDQKIYAVCELCLTGKNCLYKRESVWQERKNHTNQNKLMTFILFSQRNWKKWVFDYRYIDFLQLYINICHVYSLKLLFQSYSDYYLGFFFHNTLELWKHIL